MTVSFDELIQKAKEVALTAGKIAGDVVGEVVDTSKAKLAEAKLNAQIAEVNERLGMIVYEAVKTGKDSQKLQEMLVKELDTLYQTLEALRKSSGVTGNEIFCTQCNEKNPSGAAFCIKCGAKLVCAAAEGDYVVEADIEDAEEAAEAVAEAVEEAAEAVEEAAAVAEATVEELADKVEQAAEKLDL